MTRILVVDDELAIRVLLQDLLEDEGYTVALARNGTRALEILRREMPDLVIMDIMMPGMDGRQVLREIRQSDNLQDVPVILMSVAVVANSFPDSTCLFLPKPFDLHELLACIETVLDSDNPT